MWKMWSEIKEELTKLFAGTYYEAWYMWSMPMCCGKVVGVRIVNRDTTIKKVIEIEHLGEFTINSEGRVDIGLISQIIDILKKYEVQDEV